MQFTSVDIPISDSFDDPQGEWRFYDAVPLLHRAQMRKQRHLDIRCFAKEAASTSLRMIDLDGFDDISEVDGDTMNEMEASSIVLKTFYDENWTVTPGPLSAYNNWRGITLTAGSATSLSASSVMEPLDLWTDWNDTDLVSFALPALPLSSLNVNQCSFRFESDVLGGGLTDVPFTASTVTLVTGHSELRVPRSYLWAGHPNREAFMRSVSTVRLNITTTAACAVKVAAIRMLDPSWVYAPTDLNTLTQRVVRPVSLNGNPSATYGFPAQAEYPELPSDWPILLRADEPASGNDPQPVDISVTSVFDVGSMGVATGGQYSELSFYLRDFSLDENTMLDLQSMNMAQLDAPNRLPDYGTATYTSRRQVDLDENAQSELDLQTQFDLERLPDYTSEAYIEVRILWSNGSTVVTAYDANGVGHTFPDTVVPDFVAGSRYLAYLELEDHKLRLRIYNIAVDGTIGTLFFDTTTLEDEQAFKRRRGRFGWRAALLDGDAMVDHVRARSVTHGEVVTQELRSHTPVEGAQLLVGASPDRELISALLPTNNVVQLTAAPEKTKSGRAYRIRSKAANGPQGFITNSFSVTDFKETEISFDYLFPSYGVVGSRSIDAYLYEPVKDIYIRLNIGALLYDRWQSARIRLTDVLTEATDFKLLVVQSDPSVDTEWYIDNVSMTTRAITWEARSERPDPWDLRGEQWTPFLGTLNKARGGVVFPERGKGLQVRARTHTASAFIEDMKVVPKYAELGRFLWPDQHEYLSASPAVTFSYTATATHVANLTASVTVSPNGPVVYYAWTFGDGTSDVGPYVSHTYSSAGTYTVTLTVLDSHMRMATAIGPVTVT